MSQTEIQRVYDFLEEVVDLEGLNATIVQAYTMDDVFPPMDMPRNRHLAIQFVTGVPNPDTPWGHVIEYVPNLTVDPPTATLTLGHNHKCSFKLHCVSYLSFDEADVLADAVTDAFHHYSVYVYRDRPVIMKKHGIIKVVDGPRKTPVPPIDEPEVWHIVVDVDLEIQRVETYTVTPITKWQNFTTIVDGFLERIVLGKDRFAHPTSGKMIFTEVDPEVDVQPPS